MSQYHLKPCKLGQKLIDAYQKTERQFTEKFLQEDENSPSGYTLKTGNIGKKVTQTYQKIENGVVGSYKKIENAFVDAFLVKEDDEEQSTFPH